MSDKETKKYIEAVGRRKTSVARVRITPATKFSYSINEKALADYFDHSDQVAIVESPFKDLLKDAKYSVSVKIGGGGINSQAEAIRLGISRCLVLIDAEQRKPLKKLGFLKRDPRSKERMKPGLKKARKSPQWSKR